MVPRPKRLPRHERPLVPLAFVENLLGIREVVRGAVMEHHVVVVLNRDQTITENLVRASHVMSVDVADADEPDLSFLAQSLQCADRFVVRDIRIGRVQEVDGDRPQRQSLQASFDSGAEMLRSPVRNPDTLYRVLVATLGRDRNSIIWM